MASNSIRQNTACPKVGQHVSIQNQHGAGKVAKRWDRTGVVVEDLDFHKYRVKIDGSGRLTDRNRQFLRLFKPAKSTLSPGLTPIAHNEVSQPTTGAKNAHETEPLVDHELAPDVTASNSSDTVKSAHGKQYDEQSSYGSTAEERTSVDDCQPHIQAASRPQTLDETLAEPSHVPLPVADSNLPASPARRSSRIRRPNQLYGPDMYDLS